MGKVSKWTNFAISLGASFAPGPVEEIIQQMQKGLKSRKQSDFDSAAGTLRGAVRQKLSADSLRDLDDLALAWAMNAADERRLEEEKPKRKRKRQKKKK